MSHHRGGGEGVGEATVTTRLDGGSGKVWRLWEGTWDRQNG